jgi:hypothetical protein
MEKTITGKRGLDREIEMSVNVCVCVCGSFLTWSFCRNVYNGALHSFLYTITCL